jgi:hypothetical protein
MSFRLFDKSMGRITIGTFLAVSLFLGLSNMAQSAKMTYEKPPVLLASKLLPGQIKQKGARYVIEEQVPTDGFLMSFTIRSDFGTFVARSLEMLEQRVVEIGALGQLEKVSQTDAFVSGLQKSAVEFGKQVGNLVTEPVATLQGIPAGIGSFLDRVSRGAKTGMQRLEDVQAQDDQVAQPAKGPGATLPGKPAPGAANGSQMTVQEAAVRMTGKVTADAFGYDEQRRWIAREVRVDPYSTNPVLTDKLDELARAAFAGGLGVTVIKSAVPASMVLSTVTVMSDWVWDTAPGTLKVQNESALKSMGVSQERIDQLLRQPHFTLTLQTKLVKALQRLTQTGNRPAIMDYAVTVESFDQARFVVEAMEMLARYHEKVTPLLALDKEVAFAARTKKGTLVVAGPVDYLSWTPQIHKFAGRADLQAADRVLLLRGTATPLAKKELTAMKWKVQQKTSR